MDNSTVNNQIEKLIKTNAICQQLPEIDNLKGLSNDCHFLDLKEEIRDIQEAIKSSKENSFKIIVTGDIGAGKSTLLNALIGEDLFTNQFSEGYRFGHPFFEKPTLIRYGKEKQIYFYLKEMEEHQKFNDKQFEKLFEYHQLDFSFPSELLFKTDYIVREYPSDFFHLELEFLYLAQYFCDYKKTNFNLLQDFPNYNAIIFCISATKLCSLEERIYIEKTIKNLGITTFFLLNKWDNIATCLEKEDQQSKLEKVSRKIRDIFRFHLEPYCIIDGQNLYKERVFEVSALNAFRARKRGESLEGTGLNEFTFNLLKFLLNSRKSAISEAKTSARNIIREIHKKIAKYLEERHNFIQQLELQHSKDIVIDIQTENTQESSEIEKQLIQEKNLLKNQRENLNKLETEMEEIWTQIEETYEQYIKALWDSG